MIYNTEIIYGSYFCGGQAFCLYAEVIEKKQKPSAPIGEFAEDAFGRPLVFIDRGERERAILNTGRQDVVVDGIRPLDTCLTILGASSDHPFVDVTDDREPFGLAIPLAFSLNYSALLAAMTSPYVEKCPLASSA